MTQLTQEILKELLNYNQSTGELTWKFRSEKWFYNPKHAQHRWNVRYANQKAGFPVKSRGKPYIQITIFGKKYLAHRVIFLLMEGFLPVEIDHKNGNGEDNRWFNLRETIHEDNNRNLKLNIKNKSKVTGVFWNTRRNRWTSVIRYRYKQIHLGDFTDWFEAVCARMSANNKYKFDENHGRKRCA